MLRPHSLRARLVAGLLLVSLIGLVAAGGATFLLQRSFLLERVDQQLDDARVPARAALAAQSDDSAASTGASARRALPSGTYAEIRNRNGSTRVRATYSLSGDDDAAPRLPDQLPGSGAAGSRELFTAAAVADGGGNFRVLAEELPRGGTLIVALPLDPVRVNLRRLLLAELIVASSVLAVLSALAWWLAGIGLRPLARIGETAGAIAAGEQGRRVPDTNERTEVGRLGESINTMLGRIEQAMAERAESEERLRRFVSDASHELRTPLTSIRGYAELFRRGADQRPDDLATAMRRIEEESARMGKLVDDLLLLARLDERAPLERRPVDLAVVAADAAADARAVQPGRPVSIEVAPDATVSGDEARIRQAVGNLVGNALTHTPETAAVSISVVPEIDDVRIVVADGGPGLDPAATSRVFERFHRGDQSRAPGGTGLGLAIVKAVAEAHGGTVDAASTPGAGATFTLRLPR